MIIGVKIVINMANINILRLLVIFLRSEFLFVAAYIIAITIKTIKFMITSNF